VKIKTAILGLCAVLFFAGCEGPSWSFLEDGFAYSIIISPMVYGSVTPSLVKAGEGTKITLTVSPNPGYVLKDMRVTKLEKSEESISLSGDGGSRIFTMHASNVIVNAEFEPVTYSVSIGQATNCVVTISRESASIGEVVALNVNANPGFFLSGDSIKAIKEDLSLIEINNSDICACGLMCACETCNCEKFDYYFLMPASNVTITAECIKLYEIKIQAAGLENGNVFASHETAIQGAPIILVFTPNEGYRVKAENFSIKGTANGTSVTTNLTTEKYYIQTRTFSMPDFDITVVIEFEKIPPGTISVYFEGFYDEDINLNQHGNVIRRNWTDPVTGFGDTITVTVAAGFNRYYWYLDDHLRPENGNSITIDGYRLQLGVYTITAVVVKDGVPYSKIVTFTVVDF